MLVFKFCSHVDRIDERKILKLDRLLFRLLVNTEYTVKGFENENEIELSKEE